MLTIGLLNQLPGIRHAYFTRAGGVSTGLYASLNCGFGSGDDPAKVAENRVRALAALSLTRDRLVTVHQHHSAQVAVADALWPAQDAPRADAIVTTQAKVALGIMTADCAPVLLADPRARVVGAAHAGWRGAFNGVLEATVEAMERLGAKRGRIMAGIGPTIAQRSYEVGAEFFKTFVEQAEENTELFRPAPRDAHFMFDLKAYIARRLARIGLRAVEALPCDTCAQEDRFFSYRRACLRGESDYGRGLSVIYLER